MSKVKKPRILVAEDDAGILRIVTVALTTEGMQVLPAADGLIAFQKAVQEKPDAIVLDIGLPKMDGLAVCRKLKDTEGTADIPVGFLTAQAGGPALKSGGMLYLSKPFKPQKLVTFVHLLLAARRVA